MKVVDARGLKCFKQGQLVWLLDVDAQPKLRASFVAEYGEKEMAKYELVQSLNPKTMETETRWLRKARLGPAEAGLC